MRPSNHAVIVPFPQPRIEIAWKPCSGCVIVVYFCAFEYQMCTTTLFGLRWHFERVKQNTAAYSMRQRHQLTQTLTNCKPGPLSSCGAVRLPHKDCSISVPFYGQCIGTMWQPWGSCARAIRLSQEPTVILPFICSKMTI